MQTAAYCVEAFKQTDKRFSALGANLAGMQNGIKPTLEDYYLYVFGKEEEEK